MNNSMSSNSKFIVTYQDNNMNIDISSYETLSNDDGIELANIINKAHNDGYKTIIDCENLNVFSNNFYNSVENLSSLNFNINGQEISYDDIKAAIDASLNSSSASSNYNYSYGGSGDDSVKLDYASINQAISKLGSIVDNKDLTNIKDQINSLNPCYQELPSSSCVSTIKSNVTNSINKVSDIHNRLVNLRNYLREHDANYDYYANIQYIEGLEEFGEGLTEVEKYYVVKDKMKEIQEYQNIGSEEGMISSEIHKSVLDACVNYLDYYGYTGTEWILNKSTRTQEEQKFIDKFYNEYSQKEQSKLSDLQLATLGIIAYDKADDVSEEYLSSHEDMGSSFEQILAGRQAAIDSYTEEHAGYAVDDLSNAFFEAGKKDIEDKYDECEVAYNKYLDYLEVANSSVETIYRRELATKLPVGIDVYNSDYYSKYLTSEQSDFLISRDLIHNDDKMTNLNTELNELSNEFNELTEEKESLASQLTPQDTIDNILYFFGKYNNEYKSEINDKISEIDKKLNAVSIEMASKKSQLDFIDNNSFNLYTKFSNFGELCNSNIADYKISTNFWQNLVIDFYDKDGNKLDVSTEEGAIYIYTNQVNVEVVTDEYGDVIDSYSSELKKMMNAVHQFNFDSSIDVDYFKVLNYLNNTGNDMKFQYYYDRKYDDCLRIEGKLLADARTSVLDKHCSFVDFFSLTGWGLVDGVNQFIDGFVNLVSADGKPSAEQYMSMYMAEYVNDNYSYSEIMQGAYEISTSIGNMLPSIAASFIPVVGPYLGSALMGLSAAGNAREEGLQQGMTSAEAWVYGILSGASEVLLQRVLGGIPGISNMEKFAGMHGLTGLVFKGLSESLEESCQEVLNPVFKYLVTGDWDGIDADNVIKAGVYAFITAGIMNGGSFVTEVASMSMFGDYTAIGHVINKYSGVDLYKVSHDELTKSIKNDFKILKNSEKGLSSLVEDLSQNETIKNAYESLSDEQKEMIKFNDYVSGIAIDSTLLVGKSTTSETVNAEAVEKINLELEELNNTKTKMEEDIKANREARNNTTDLAESLKLDEELTKLNDQLSEVNEQIASKSDELNVYSLATSLLDPKQFALLLATDPVTANNVYLTASLASAFNMEETEIIKSEEVIEAKEETVAEDIVAETTVDETIKDVEVQVEYDQEKIDLELKAIDKLRKQIEKIYDSSKEFGGKYDATNNKILKAIYKSKLEKNQAKIFELAGPCIRSIDGMIKNGVEGTIDGNWLEVLRNNMIGEVIREELFSLIKLPNLYYIIDDTALQNPDFNNYLKKSIISVANKFNLGIGDIIYSLRYSDYFRNCGYNLKEDFFEALFIDFSEEYFRKGKIDVVEEIVKENPNILYLNSFAKIFLENYNGSFDLIEYCLNNKIYDVMRLIDNIILNDYTVGLTLVKDGIKKGILTDGPLASVIKDILYHSYEDGFKLAKDEIDKGTLTGNDLVYVIDKIFYILSENNVEEFKIDEVIEIIKDGIEKGKITYDELFLGLNEKGLCLVVNSILSQNYEEGIQLLKDEINKGILTDYNLVSVIHQFYSILGINEAIGLVNVAVEKGAFTKDDLLYDVIKNILSKSDVEGFKINEVVSLVNIAVEKGAFTKDDLLYDVIKNILYESNVEGFKINEVIALVNIAVEKGALTKDDMLCDVINTILYQDYVDDFKINEVASLVNVAMEKGTLTGIYLTVTINTILSRGYKEGIQLARDGIKYGLFELLGVILSHSYKEGLKIVTDGINEDTLTGDYLADSIRMILSKSDVEGFKINEVVSLANIAVKKGTLIGNGLDDSIRIILSKSNVEGFKMDEVVDLANIAVEKGTLTDRCLTNVIYYILSKSDVEGFEIDKVVDLANIAVEKGTLTGNDLVYAIKNILSKSEVEGFEIDKVVDLANIAVEKDALTGDDLADSIRMILSKSNVEGFEIDKVIEIANIAVEKGTLTGKGLVYVIDNILFNSNVEGFEIDKVVDLANIAMEKGTLTGNDLADSIRMILSKSDVEGFEIDKVVDLANIAVEKGTLTGKGLATVISSILSLNYDNGLQLAKDEIEKGTLTGDNLGIVINAILSKNEAEGLRMIEDYDKEDLSDVIRGLLKNNISGNIATKLLTDLHKRIDFDAKVKLAKYSDDSNIKKMSNSNSPMIRKFFAEFYCYLLNYDENAIEFNTDLLINVFESQKIPEFYKRLIVYKFVHNGGLVYGRDSKNSVASEILLSLETDEERTKILTQDLLSVAIESHSDSLYEFFANIEDAFRVVDDIKSKGNIGIDNLTVEEKQTISYLLDLYYSYETMNGGRIIDLSDKDFSDSDLISELGNILNMGREEYLTKLFGIDYNPEIVKKMNTTYMDEYIRNTDKQNRKFAQNIGNDVVLVEKGTSFKGLKSIAYIGTILQNGILCPEFFGLTSETNGTPLDIDCFDAPSDIYINKLDESAFGFCDAFIKKDSMYKYERIDRGLYINRPASYYRTGIASQDIEFLVLYDSSKLEALKLELVKNGLYIPIIDGGVGLSQGDGGTGKIIFTPEEFDILRSKYLNGLSTYGMGDYVFDSSVANSDASKIFSMLSKEGIKGENEFLNIPIIKNIINNASSTSQNISEDTKVFLERISGSKFVSRESIITSFEEMNFKSLSMEDAIELYKKFKSGELDFMYDQSMSDSQKLLLLQKMSDLDVQVKSNAVHKWFENKLQAATKELGMTDLEIKEFIDKVILAGSLELIDTGSTSRGANFPGDGDFDFVIRTDIGLLEDAEKFNALINKMFGVPPVANAVKHYSITVDYNGNENLSNSEGDSFTLDGDFSFLKKHDLGTLSTEGALYERYKSMEYDRETRAQVIANVWLCKKLLKQAGIYKKADNGLGGVGVENLILYNGGSLDKAARSILEASRTIAYEDYKKSNPHGNFISYLDEAPKITERKKFSDKYKLIDVGENHYTFEGKTLKENGKDNWGDLYYPNDDYIFNLAVLAQGKVTDNNVPYQKTIDAFEQYVRSLSYDLGGLDMSIPDANLKSIETSTDTDISKKIGMSLEEIQALENIPVEIIQEIFEGTDYYRRLMGLLSNT